jgi:hypothetical protein
LGISAPAFATGAEWGGGSSGIPVGVELGVDVVSFADAIVSNGIGAVNFFRSFLDDDVCPECPHLHGQHNFLPKRTKIDGKIAVYYVCEYCGLSAGEVLEDKYTDYVGTLPGTRYNSDGAFIWSPGAVDFVGSSVVFYYQIAANSSAVQSGSKQILLTSAFPSCSFSAQNGSTWSASGTALAYIGDFVHLDLRHRNSYNYNYSRFWIDWGTVVIPMNGIYTLLGGSGCSISGSAFEAGVQVHLGAGASVSPYIPTTAEDFSHDFLWPSFEVRLYEGGSGGNTFDISTRFSGAVSNGGMFGYVDNGQLCQSSVDTIYDEVTNIYSNPVTGDTTNIASWDYDYSDRSYHLTTEEGDTLSVTYGDESVVINEGGTSYTVYYLVEEPEDVQEDTITHTHDWVDSVTTVPTCTASGLRTRTCTICGWATTEVIPATGHSFSAPVVTQEPTCTVPGIRAGTCSVCGQTTTEPVPALGHDYQASVTMEPGCVVTGVQTHTCTRCGDSYTTSIPATGHRWAKVSSVPTQYDEVTGELVQQGYTLYRCQNCNEEYRVTSETGGALLPDAGGGGASSGTGAGNTDLTAMAQEALEASPTVLQLLSGWFTALPASFAGFSGFLKVSFGWMPPEVVTMLSFSVGMICFIGVFRFGFRR